MGRLKRGFGRTRKTHAQHDANVTNAHERCFPFRLNPPRRRRFLRSERPSRTRACPERSKPRRRRKRNSPRSNAAGRKASTTKAGMMGKSAATWKDARWVNGTWDLAQFAK